MLLHPRNSTRPWPDSSISSRPVSKCTDHSGSISGRVGNQVWLDRCWQKVEGGAAVTKDKGGGSSSGVSIGAPAAEVPMWKMSHDQAHGSRNGKGKRSREVTERRKEGGEWAGVTRQEGMGSRRDGIDKLHCQGQNKAFLSFSGSEQIDSKKTERKRRAQRWDKLCAHEPSLCGTALWQRCFLKEIQGAHHLFLWLPAKKRQRNFEIVIWVAHSRKFFRIFWVILESFYSHQNKVFKGTSIAFVATCRYIYSIIYSQIQTYRYDIQMSTNHPTTWLIEC